MGISDLSSDVCSSDLLLLQHLPEGEVGRDRLHVRHDHPEWAHARTIAETLKPEELTDPATSLETLAWRLFHEEEEVRIEPGFAVSPGCRCSRDYFDSWLSKFPLAERLQLPTEGGNIEAYLLSIHHLFPPHIH